MMPSHSQRGVRNCRLVAQVSTAITIRGPLSLWQPGSPPARRGLELSPPDGELSDPRFNVSGNQAAIQWN